MKAKKKKKTRKEGGNKSAKSKAAGRTTANSIRIFAQAERTLPREINVNPWCIHHCEVIRKSQRVGSLNKLEGNVARVEKRSRTISLVMEISHCCSNFYEFRIR